MEHIDTYFGDTYTSSDRFFTKKDRENLKTLLGLTLLLLAIAFVLSLQWETFLKSFRQIKITNGYTITYKVI